MTALEKKVFTSSNPMTVLLSCPPPCGHFSIQESAEGGLSYKVKNTIKKHIITVKIRLSLLFCGIFSSSSGNEFSRISV